MKASYLRLKKRRWPTPLADAVREGHAPPPAMLGEGWLVQGELHWVAAEAEAAKTWLALWWAKQLIEADTPRLVVWFDEELGQREIVSRLVCLGADPERVASHFADFDFPGFDASQDDVEAHAAIMQALRPALAVYDTATDMLAGASIDEANGPDVTRWIKRYPELAAKQYGVTAVVLDHMPKASDSDRRYAVGSRAKRAKAKVGYHLKLKKKFSPAETGTLEIELTKNTRGADIPTKRVYKIGGGNRERGQFQFTQQTDLDALADAYDEVGAPTANLDARITQAVQAAGTINFTKLREATGGTREKVADRARALAEHPELSGFRLEVGGPGRSNQLIWQGLPEPAADSTEPATT